MQVRSSNGLSLLNTHKADYSSIDAYNNFKFELICAIKILI